MQINTISPAGDWSIWTEELKNELPLAQTNTNVGEKIVFENDKFRIWTIHLEPGKRLPLHKHENPYFWTILSDGKSRSYYESGLIEEVTYSKGDTKWFSDISRDKYFIHNLENVGDTTLIFTTVEFL